MNEITLKDIYEIIDKRITGLETKIEKYHDSFIHFEEGKLTQALQDIETNKGEISLLKKAMEKKEDTQENQAERRKNWYWGALEKVIFIIVGFILTLTGLVLKKLGIINF